MFASFWSGVMRLLIGNYFLVFILILFTFPLQSCLLSKSFEIKLIYFTVYSNSMSCFAESFKPFIHKSLFNVYHVLCKTSTIWAQYYWLSGVSWRMMMGWTGWIIKACTFLLTETFIYVDIMWDGQKKFWASLASCLQSLVARWKTSLPLCPRMMRFHHRSAL